MNQLLVRQGFALNFEPDAQGRFKEDEANAKRDRRGLWKGCFVAPEDFRVGRTDGALLGDACPADKDREIRDVLFPKDPAMPPGCSIKGKFAVRARVTGNVGIYHLQGCPSYPALTQPDRWFCSEEDAQAAGFRKAYNCRHFVRQADVTILSHSKTKQRRRRRRPQSDPGGDLHAPLHHDAVRWPDLASAGPAFAQNATPHNLILFVPDGLRGRIVTTETAPAMAEMRDKGVNFRNSHSLFPTFTMANASAMATGHYLGDTGDFSQHDLHRLSRRARRRHRHALPRDRSGDRSTSTSISAATI